MNREEREKLNLEAFNKLPCVKCASKNGIGCHKYGKYLYYYYDTSDFEDNWTNYKFEGKIFSVSSWHKEKEEFDCFIDKRVIQLIKEMKK